MNLDKDLVSEIRDIAQTAGIKELSSVEAQTLTETVQRGFIKDPARLWWWEALATNAETFSYEEEDGIAIIRTIVPENEPIWIVITDDEHGPWPAWKGKAGDILDMLEELRFFEYFLVGNEHRWIIFDTHHNSLVAAGDIVNRLQLLKSSLNPNA